MKNMMHMLLCLLSLALIASCAPVPKFSEEYWVIDKSNLPPPDISLNVPSLGPCTHNPDRTLHLNSNQPVTVLVHGCRGSTGLFRSLAQVIAFHGQQTICFNYDDRDGLMKSSGELTAALDKFGQQMKNKNISVIGHSQGALVARKALVSDRADATSNPHLNLRLVTVSGPFNGIDSAYQCNNPVTRVLTLGLIGLACHIVTSSKWTDITYTSDFIRKPGKLNNQVHEYLKIDTDEAGTCRKLENDKCVESDEIFSLAEQENNVIDKDPMTRIEMVKAGHVEIVGDERVAPLKLIGVLQKHNLLARTDPQRLAEFDVLLHRIYGAGF